MEARLKRRVVATRLTLFLTTAAYVLSVIYAVRWLDAMRHPTLIIIFCNILYLFLISAFAYGNFLYQLTRIGYYSRLREHHGSRQTDQVPFGVHEPDAQTLSILIPTYKEELSTVQQTLYSAVLQNYPRMVVSVLIDDPDAAPGTIDHFNTQKTLHMIDACSQAMARLHSVYAHALLAAEDRLAKLFDAKQELDNLAETYLSVAKRLRHIGSAVPGQTHTDKLFARKVFAENAAWYEAQAKQIAVAGLEAADIRQYLLEHYAWLRDIFDIRIVTLQRKQYANLSHEPNKAMNINSYLSLMGGAYKVAMHDGKRMLEAADDASANITIPDTDYVITLDADSILDHRYASTLIGVMEQPQNDRVAVMQTPYSAITGSTQPIERVAGATTDIQYIIHQGFTRYRATYWVGANALLRKTALDDIAEPIEGETLVRQYIQDRTVIEDTESSIDLVKKGWSLYNYPERLAFSATPDDYGSLLIQRRRWANGGLIILPKLVRYLVSNPSLKKAPEAFMRVHYLVSIAIVNISLVVMLFVPLDKVGFSLWVLATAVPYFCLYHRDLRIHGYGRLDILRVYALNLLLIPINLGGVFKSIQQLITGNKIPFGRTPKVGTKVSAPALYHLVTYGFFLYLLYLTVADITSHRFLYAALLAVNVFFFGYGLIVFIGVQSSWEDISRILSRSSLRARKRREA